MNFDFCDVTMALSMKILEFPIILSPETNIFYICLKFIFIWNCLLGMGKIKQLAIRSTWRQRNRDDIWLFVCCRLAWCYLHNCFVCRQYHSQRKVIIYFNLVLLQYTSQLVSGKQFLMTLHYSFASAKNWKKRLIICFSDALYQKV